MAQANVFYKGEEGKFAFDINVEGFNMDTDDFDLEVTSPKDSVIVRKTGQPDPQRGIWSNEDGSLVVFSETEEVVVPAEDQGGEPTITSKTVWYAIVDTKGFVGTGQLTVIATAYIIEPKAYDGVRKSIDVAALGTLKTL